jgi:bacterial/archaeal transporter family-2 protein
MILVFFLAALLVGMGQPIQAAINAQLRTHLGDPAWATMVSVLVSTTAIALYLLIRRVPPPALKVASGAPWWLWTGGLLGVTFVAAGLVVTPRLGAGITFALIVLGQMTASLVLDQWGLLGLPIHHANPLRVLGVAMLVGGVVLVRSF